MIDFEKFGKYSKAGPRYTSYPTAVEFNSYFNETTYTENLKNQDATRPISLYFHLPFCRSACYFCGCNVVYTSKDDKKERYITYLEKELEILSRFLDTSREVRQMHFGGGTPTFFDDKQLDRIIKMIKNKFPNFSTDVEISCEIDPRFINEEQLDVMVGHGFNRVSFGIQDFDEKVQVAVHRVQSYELSKRAIDLSREKGIVSVNVDLIYGLPFQTYETFKTTLDLARSLNPDRLAVFNYAHVPWMKKTMRKIDETTLPTPSVKLEIMKYTIDYFENNGYKMIGMDHFAKPEDELFKALKSGELHRNFQGYTTKGGADLIGIGLSSIGEGEAHYVQNYKEMNLYEEAIDAGKLPVERGVKLSEDDVIRQYVIMELMSNFSLNIKRFEEKFDVKFESYFSDALKDLELFVNDRLVEISDEGISVSATGAMLIRNIAMPFDTYLKKIPESKRQFSKTV